MARSEWTWLEVVSVILLVAYTAMIAYFVAAPQLGWPRAVWLMHVSPLALFGFALFHGGLTLGWRNALAFWGISFVVSLAFESVGVMTGAIYGHYHYSDMLGFKIFGLVPAIIPLAWFMMMYSCHCLVNANDGGRASRNKESFARIVWLAFVSGMAMTAWDLSLDPMMTYRGVWVWEDGGPYFGIPIQNFVGWLITTFTVFLLYRLFETRWPPLPADSRPFAHLPISAYAVVWLGEVTSNMLNGDPAIGLISFFAMGGFVLMGVTWTLR